MPGKCQSCVDLKEEIEAAATFQLEKAALEFITRRMTQRHQTLATKDQVMQMLVDFHREAFKKTVKGDTRDESHE